jgi:hypothetical protein
MRLYAVVLNKYQGQFHRLLKYSAYSRCREIQEFYLSVM